MSILEKISSPDDLKKLSYDQLNTLSEEIRKLMIDTVSKTGGHLSSNLGVVELSIALHKVFDSPQDKIIWDVSHQVYTHKILTGRYRDFSSLRQENGISGFSSPAESEHDIFYTGHSSASVSQALGIATANSLSGKNNYTIAVIGDGALTGGLAYEALNNAAHSGKGLIVILNDNKMSISENVGSMARYLAAIRTKPEYFKLKAQTESAINKIPVIGKKTSKAIFDIKTTVKNKMYKSTFFEDLGFRYMGPIDGHNIEQLCEALDAAKLIDVPVLLHINSVKGKGYNFAEMAPSEFHGISKFNIYNGESQTGSDNFSGVFGSELCRLAEKDTRICAITAAMALGTGLEDFSQKYKDRFFDVGIAEEHAVTFASGLAKGGMKPVVAVYSTFLQRAYDQLIHDISLQKSDVVIAVDRAGFVGEDGITHQGLFDVPMLNTVPDIEVYSPCSYSQLRSDLKKAIDTNGPVAVRYPRGGEDELPAEISDNTDDFILIGNSGKCLLVSYGSEAAECYKAYEKLGKYVSLLILNRIKPVSFEDIKGITDYKMIVFCEESEKTGGIGENMAEYLELSGYRGRFLHKAVNDEFVPHANVKRLREIHKLDADSIIKEITELI